MHDFDLLMSLIRQSTVEFAEADLEALQRIRRQLYLDVDILEAIDVNTAHEWALRLSDRVRAGSRALGEAIIASGDAADRGDLDTAKTEIRSFLDSCDMPFYRQIAEARMREYHRL